MQNRPGRSRVIAAIGAVVTVVLALVALSDLSWVPTAVLAPVLEYQRVERPTDGFAMDIPPDWEYVVAAEADPERWWDSEKGDPDETHEQFLSQGAS